MGGVGGEAAGQIDQGEPSRADRVLELHPGHEEKYRVAQQVRPVVVQKHVRQQRGQAAELRDESPGQFDPVEIGRGGGAPENIDVGRGENECQPGDAALAFGDAYWNHETRSGANMPGLGLGERFGLGMGDTP
ncbi:MAG: hypothetical protein BWZ10_03165 [candidate division BRC1 bacterium ADurb.BinA364]|nr:MAG: hypothetical protein BWZ10_03165 [candidate division BRC1 bacterium ADurb.BinA364]